MSELLSSDHPTLALIGRQKKQLLKNSTKLTPPKTPMFDTLCTYPLTSDLFAQAIHPVSPLIVLGLASGHVQLNRLPTSPGLKTGHGTIETAWRTRRHKGSCRTLAFDHDGSLIFSAGTDGIVKVADTETGKVVSKIAVPPHLSVPTTQHLPNLTCEMTSLRALSPRHH